MFQTNVVGENIVQPDRPLMTTWPMCISW